MSKTKNAHKSNQYECLGRDTASPLVLNILWSSCCSAAGGSDNPILAEKAGTAPEVIPQHTLQNNNIILNYITYNNNISTMCYFIYLDYIFYQPAQ